jgi:hypothetical protein
MQTGVMNDLATIELGDSTVVLRRAEAGDVPAVVGLLAADQLGAIRDGVNTAQDLAAYQVAFRAIDADPATAQPGTSQAASCSATNGSMLCMSCLMVKLGQQGDRGVGGGMRVVAPPDHLQGNGRGVPQRAEDHAVAGTGRWCLRE